MLMRKLSGITFADVICKIYDLSYSNISRIVGTASFRVKAYVFGVKVSGSVVCFGTVHVVRAPRSEIVIGKRVQIISATKRCTASTIYAPARLKTLSGSAKIIVGDDVGLNGTSIVARSMVVRIGNGVMIAPNVTIMDSDFHALWPPEDRLTSPAFETDADINIGAYVWIGMQSIILKGVTIGENSIIAAGSVVTSDIPPNVVAGGVPAKTIRQLNN